jgi:hypothetical protein
MKQFGVTSADQGGGKRRAGHGCEPKFVSFFETPEMGRYQLSDIDDE